MSTPAWGPAVFTQPGDLIARLSTPPPNASPPNNANFEAGNSGWTLGTGWSIGQFGTSWFFDGTWSARANYTGSSAIQNTNVPAVVPGQEINASCMVQQGPSSAGVAGGWVALRWFTSALVLIREDEGNHVTSTSNGNWSRSSVTGVAPAGAAFVAILGYQFRNSGSGQVALDLFTWDYVAPASVSTLIYKAVQPAAGYTGTSEPVWPTVLGNTVVDNEVIWQAVYTSRVVWTAHPLLPSGGVEPAFPTVPGNTVADNSRIVWTATTGRIVDSHLPQSKIVAIAASKVFAGDDDIAEFSATINPKDWTTEKDAGYLPFGLQTYGENPITAMGLYRKNLVIFNDTGLQMWQVDEDPQNMALLDAVQIGCSYGKTVIPVGNDLMFLSALGARNLSIAAASTNLQAGNFGQAVDPLVRAAMLSADLSGTEPFGIYYPSQGQYWLFFGAQAFVLTINGKGRKPGWSRYIFPEEITDWTILAKSLYLRTITDKILQLDDATLLDDYSAGAGTTFTSVVQWPHLDFGSLGVDKMMIACDLVGKGNVNVSIGYDGTNFDARTPDYNVNIGTVQNGQPIPIPVAGKSFSLRLEFTPNQAWEWNAANIYVDDLPVTT